MRGIRIILEPQFVDTVLGQFVSTTSLGLQMRGVGAKSLNNDGPHQARLHFLIGYMEAARDAPPNLERFASFDGQIEVADPRKPIITLSLDALPTFAAPEPGDGDDLPREIKLVFDEDSFSEAPDENSPESRLRLPEPPDGARFAELGAELEIDGALDSPAQENDRLDLVLRNFAEITLLDEEKLPMSGSAYKVMMGDLEVTSGLLDDKGFARVEGLPLGPCTVIFPELGDESVRVLARSDVPRELL